MATGRPLLKNLLRFRGDTEPIALRIKKLDGTAVDITGYTYKLTVTSAAEPADATTKIFDVSGTLTTPASGYIEFRPTADNVDITGEYFYDIQQTDSAGYIKTIMLGRWISVQDRTK